MKESLRASVWSEATQQCERYTKTMIVLSPAVSLVPGLRFVLYSLPKDIFMWFSFALATKHH